MLKIIMLKEWRAAQRSGLLLTGTLLLLVMLGIAFAGSRREAVALQQQRLSADSLFRTQWEQMKVSNPHDAAHFGTYLFKPLTIWSSFDNGINKSGGHVMRVEAHVQHTPAAAPVSPADNYLRFGSLTMATVLLLFFPLFIIFYCHNSYTREREWGTLKLLFIQGANKRILLPGKSLTALFSCNGMLLLGLLVYLPLLFLYTPVQPAAGTAIRIFFLVVAYSMYASIFVLLSIRISAVVQRSGQALMWLLGIWLLGNVLLPRMIAGIGAIVYPLPSQYAFQAAVSKAEKFGINGDESREQRQQKLEQAWLTRYHVKTVAELPVNFDAIQLQDTEDYMQRIYEQQVAVVDSIIRLQNRLSVYASWIDPYLAVRNISMAVCGTDYAHHAHFFAAARAYRNDFIRRLNHELAWGGSRTGDPEWKADPAFFRKIPPFVWQPPAAGRVLQQQWMSFAALLGWLLLICSGLKRLSRYEAVI
ncbi:DUF3526 domain-containing protein [Chitinophaga nivalis]|uniref:DUF3526 domain-containing protein n=1 Tax=Chitinophaga nivalis TaxID=2991709 RepID=A0ABT3IIN6_9BACT|nr:DUF3526 domain-containing protein [Chitinophaga nivalis]MCW3466700.1 DUF3526 domain-containing protein [Chitinophaga nivalis]MCW3483609.1 DUF3526 domain-containing protein [Chitinophaga nivalis]